MFELDRFEEYMHEMAINEQVSEMTERLFELAKESMEKTLQKHQDECNRIIEIREIYNITQKQWDNSNLICLICKLNEIYDTLDDSYFLLLSAKYNSARILLRKWIELVVISIRFDIPGEKEEVEKEKREDFLKVNQMRYSIYGRSIKKLKQTPNKKIIADLYAELSLYAHNEGEEYGQLLPYYAEKEFTNLFELVNKIQSSMEEMIAENCNT